jgi:hypothetical protein
MKRFLILLLLSGITTIPALVQAQTCEMRDAALHLKPPYSGPNCYDQNHQIRWLVLYLPDFNQFALLNWATKSEWRMPMQLKSHYEGSSPLDRAALGQLASFKMRSKGIVGDDWVLIDLAAVEASQGGGPSATDVLSFDGDWRPIEDMFFEGILDPSSSADNTAALGFKK